MTVTCSSLGGLVRFAKQKALAGPNKYARGGQILADRRNYLFTGKPTRGQPVRECRNRFPLCPDYVHPPAARSSASASFGRKAVRCQGHPPVYKPPPGRQI